MIMISCFLMPFKLFYFFFFSVSWHEVVTLTFFSLSNAPLAFIESVQTPCANGREGGRAAEPSSWRQPLTTITVSKKRNWLQQSSLGKNHCTKDELQGMLGAEEEGSHCSHQPPPPPSPSPDHLRPSGGAPPQPVRLQLPQVSFNTSLFTRMKFMEVTQHPTRWLMHFSFASCFISCFPRSLTGNSGAFLIQVSVGQAKVSAHPRSVDPAEENDADDEGEIWYNPIPEDDEPDMSHRPSIRLLVPRRTEPERRPSRGGDGGHSGRTLEVGGGAGPEALGEGHGDGPGDGSQGNAVHSTEALHLHRQMLACKPQEEGGPSNSRATGEAKKRKPSTPSLVFLFPCCFSATASFTLSLTFLWANYFLSFSLSASHSGQIFVVVHTLSTNYSCVENVSNQRINRLT